MASHQTASAGNWRNAPHLAPPSPAPRTHARCQHIALPSVHSPAGRRHTALLTTKWLDNATCGHLHQAETSAQNRQSAASNSSYPQFCKSPISLTTNYEQTEARSSTRTHFPVAGWDSVFSCHQAASQPHSSSDTSELISSPSINVWTAPTIEY